MQRTAKALDFIVTSLVEKNMAAKSGPPNLPDVDKKREEGTFLCMLTKSSLNYLNVNYVRV